MWDEVGLSPGVEGSWHTRLGLKALTSDADIETEFGWPKPLEGLRANSPGMEEATHVTGVGGEEIGSLEGQSVLEPQSSQNVSMRTLNSYIALTNLKDTSFYHTMRIEK